MDKFITVRIVEKQKITCTIFRDKNGNIVEQWLFKVFIHQFVKTDVASNLIKNFQFMLPIYITLADIFYCQT